MQAHIVDVTVPEGDHPYAKMWSSVARRMPWLRVSKMYSQRVVHGRVCLLTLRHMTAQLVSSIESQKGRMIRGYLLPLHLRSVQGHQRRCLAVSDHPLSRALYYYLVT